MLTTASPIEQFFKCNEANSANRDIPALVAQFADVFMAAGPQGTQAVKASDFALALPRRFQLFESHGSKSTTLVSLRESRLSARFIMAETRWSMVFARNEGREEQIFADSVFIVDTGAEPFKIVFYLSKEDPRALLRSRELVPHE
jgi:hypothetical protein